MYKSAFSIIHGTEDPVLPFVHAKVMHKTIDIRFCSGLKGQDMRSIMMSGTG